MSIAAAPVNFAAKVPRDVEQHADPHCAVRNARFGNEVQRGSHGELVCRQGESLCSVEVMCSCSGKDWR